MDLDFPGGGWDQAGWWRRSGHLKNCCCHYWWEKSSCRKAGCARHKPVHWDRQSRSRRLMQMTRIRPPRRKGNSADSRQAMHAPRRRSAIRRPCAKYSTAGSSVARNRQWPASLEWSLRRRATLCIQRTHRHGPVWRQHRIRESILEPMPGSLRMLQRACRVTCC